MPWMLHEKRKIKLINLNKAMHHFVVPYIHRNPVFTVKVWFELCPLSHSFLFHQGEALGHGILLVYLCDLC